MRILPGAEPFTMDGFGELAGTGVLLVHGFTGTPQSMRAWGEHLAAAGLTVHCPLLPGHGTRWQDMTPTRWDDWYGEVDRAFRGLHDRCDEVFVMGLSMGGTLTLRLAELHADEVAGIVVVNASLATERKDAKYLLPLLSKVLPSLPGIGSDIKREGARELAYDRVPLPPAYSLQRAWPVVRADLHRITCPVLAFRSAVDHVVEPISGRLLLEGCAGNGRVEEWVLTDSYHVATLDNDASTIFDGSLSFVRAHRRGAADVPAEDQAR